MSLSRIKTLRAEQLSSLPAASAPSPSESSWRFVNVETSVGVFEKPPEPRAISFALARLSVILLSAPPRLSPPNSTSLARARARARSRSVI
jgi:hypothetical protein